MPLPPDETLQNKNPRTASRTRDFEPHKPCQYIRGQGDMLSGFCRSGGLQVVRRGLASLSICDEVKSNLLSLVQAVESGALNGADVHEDILAAIVRLDEAKAFLAVEPLYGSLRHENFFQVR